jgi:hypothetical protein
MKEITLKTLPPIPEFIDKDGNKATQEEIDAQLKRIKDLEEIEYENMPETFNKILDECTEFENKYC